MTLPTAPQRDTAAHPIPRAATALIAQFDGWTHDTTHATGPYIFGGLSEDADGEGKRHRVEVTEDVDSVCLRARHVDDGRRLVAVWIKRKAWSLDVAFRWSWPWEHGIPLKVTATELTAYVTDPVPRDPREVAREAEQLARDLDELAQHRARWEANRDVWVPSPRPWRCVTSHDVVIGRDGRLWTIAEVFTHRMRIDGHIALVTGVRATCGDAVHSTPHVDLAAEVQVLVPVPLRDALTLLRAELGSRIMSTTERKTA